MVTRVHGAFAVVGVVALCAGVTLVAQAGGGRGQAAAAKPNETLSQSFRESHGRDVEYQKSLNGFKIFDNLYFFGLNTIGAWAIPTSQGIVLIDALNNVDEAEHMIEAGLVKVGLKPADVKMIIVGHGHFDHFGGTPYFQQKYGAKVAMSKVDWDIIAKPNPNATAAQAARPLPKRDVELVDGQKVTLGDETITIKITPGHTPGSIAVLLDSGEALVGDIAVDLFGLRKRPGKPVVAWNEAQNEESVRRLAALDLLLDVAGHQAPLVLDEQDASGRAEADPGRRAGQNHHQPDPGGVEPGDHEKHDLPARRGIGSQVGAGGDGEEPSECQGEQDDRADAAAHRCTAGLDPEPQGHLLARRDRQRSQHVAEPLRPGGGRQQEGAHHAVGARIAHCCGELQQGGTGLPSGTDPTRQLAQLSSDRRWSQLGSRQQRLTEARGRRQGSVQHLRPRRHSLEHVDRRRPTSCTEDFRDPPRCCRRHRSRSGPARDGPRSQADSHRGHRRRRAPPAMWQVAADLAPAERSIRSAAEVAGRRRQSGQQAACGGGTERGCQCRLPDHHTTAGAVDAGSYPKRHSSSTVSGRKGADGCARRSGPGR